MSPAASFDPNPSIEPLLHLSGMLNRQFPKMERPWLTVDWKSIEHQQRWYSQFPDALRLAHVFQTIISDIILAEPDPAKRDYIIKTSPTYEQLLEIAARKVLDDSVSEIERVRQRQSKRASKPRNHFDGRQETSWTLRGLVEDIYRSMRGNKTNERLWDGLYNRLSELGCDPKVEGKEKLTMQHMTYGYRRATATKKESPRRITYRSFVNMLGRIRKLSKQNA